MSASSQAQEVYVTQGVVAVRTPGTSLEGVTSGTSDRIRHRVFATKDDATPAAGELQPAFIERTRTTVRVTPLNVCTVVQTGIGGAFGIPHEFGHLVVGRNAVANTGISLVAVSENHFVSQATREGHYRLFCICRTRCESGRTQQS